MKKNTKIIVLCLLAVLFVGCNSSNENAKRSQYFRRYMRETFPEYKITDGEYLLILKTGCHSCVLNTTSMLLQNADMAQSRFQAVLISQEMASNFPEDIKSLNKNVLIDSTNKLDQMNFGVYGFAILQIKHKKIVSLRSMTVEDYKKGDLSFL